ncbi:MAG: class I SAM-dependent methyltransferase [Acidiferrobacter sp.]
MTRAPARMIMDPVRYEEWYHTRRGRWIGDTEGGLLTRMLRPRSGGSCLDVGCGTGYFSRRFADAGLVVTALDPEERMLAYARSHDDRSLYVRGDAQALPFADKSFDYCTAVTSLCFVVDPTQALREMLRVARHMVLLGLLNRQGVLYRQKSGRGGYSGARWDRSETVKGWLEGSGIPVEMRARTAVFCPGGHALARLAEHCLSTRLPWGSFLAVSFLQP